MAFLVVVLAAVLLTVVGALEFIDQLSAAQTIKSGIITMLLDLGLVVVGPVLLLAYVRLMPALPDVPRLRDFMALSHKRSQHRSR